MRLKSLSVQGYKSFAAKTEFLFSPGITAIIGPNGSGKSNVADAIRWVLGEQSMQTLRGKSTTDMIFAGGRRRAQAGAAEVLLTLDNADGWLPIDFSEVTIGRRAHRSGENEYLINGARVRLRDVTELLAESGLSQRAYAVIGQGLVDAALSLRPQERRTLFEEAAGISFYRTRREESVRRLEETRRNLERVRDIVNEITPRLVRLEAEARRVEEQQRLVAHLRRLQHTWYGFEWGQQQAALGHAQRRAAALEADLQRRRAQVTGVAERVERLREQETELRGQLRDWHRQRADLHEQADTIQRELAVARERLRLEQSRRSELAAELEPLRAQRVTQEQRAKQLRAEVDELQQTVEARARELEAQEAHWRALQENAQQPARRRARVEERLRAHREELARLDQALRRAQAEAARLASERAVAEERVRHLRERAQQVQGEIEPVAAQVEMQAERALLAKRRVDEQKAMLRERRDLLKKAEREAKVEPGDAELAKAAMVERDRLANDLRDARAHLTRIEQALAEQRAVAAGLSGELAALNRTLGQGTAYGAGVRALLEAGWAGSLGPLGGLMHVPPELEKTLEAALREPLRSVVVDSAALAREVQVVLAAAGGRATIVPLDAMRPPPSAEGKPDLWPEGAQRLADLISCDSAVRPAVEATLGLVALCHDLDEAQALLPELPPGSMCITADGALLASSGAITLGPAETTEVLAGERERRELPARLVGVQQASDALEAQQQETQDQVRALEVAVRNADLQVQQARERAERARLEALSQMRTEIAVIEEAVRSDDASMARESALLDQLRAQMRELAR
ncbi:MAG: AAA family ATPase, partial [Anaerolineales bacterium]|nr:AAA family ATPase [Anaerolineales bacterium]